MFGVFVAVFIVPLFLIFIAPRLSSRVPRLRCRLCLPAILHPRSFACVSTIVGVFVVICIGPLFIMFIVSLVICVVLAFLKHLCGVMHRSRRCGVICIVAPILSSLWCTRAEGLRHSLPSPTSQLSCVCLLIVLCSFHCTLKRTAPS